MQRAGAGSMAKVNGSASAIATAPLIPGMAPPMTPQVTPATMRTKRWSSIALANPAARPDSAVTGASPRQHALQDPVGDRDEQSEPEHGVERHREQAGRGHQRAPGGAAVDEHEPGHVERRGQPEPQPLERQHVEHEEAHATTP